MNKVLKILVAVVPIILVSACTTYTGDKLLDFTDADASYDQDKIVSQARKYVSNLLNDFNLSADRKLYFEKIRPIGVIRDDAPLHLGNINNYLVIAKAKTDIAFATNSIIIVSGPLHISHSGNNIVVCADDVDISHDGSMENGSLVISKGKTEISHAGNTLIYAVEGIEISHARNVQAFNTRVRKTSWGHISNVIIGPLFSDEIDKSDRPITSPLVK